MFVKDPCPDISKEDSDSLLLQLHKNPTNKSFNIYLRHTDCGTVLA
jgi:hypothetical protein